MLNQRKIFFFWLPLFASWLLMTTEGPIIHTAITRLSDPVVTLASFGIVMALAVTIESPIIMLLATSTALAVNRQAYFVLRRFTFHLNLILTVVAAALAFYNPLYDWLVPGLMGIPPEIAAVAQVGMKIMVFWTAAIGWRRFNQGILIRFGRTKQVTIGTMIRLILSISVTFGTGFLLDLPGMWAGTIGLMVGVTAEALFIYWAASRVKAKYYQNPSEPGEEALTYKAVVKFHAPLAATSLLSLLTQPLIGAGLARMLLPEESLAVWPVIFGLLLIFRSAGFALPEVIIALSGDRNTFKPIRNFSFNIGFATTLFVLLIIITPIARVYLTTVTGLPAELTRVAVPGLAISLLLPFLTIGQNWLRGLLMKAKATAHIYLGMGINLAVTGFIVFGGVMVQAPGIQTAAAALSIATLFEVLFLWRRIKPLLGGGFQNPFRRSSSLAFED